MDDLAGMNKFSYLSPAHNSGNEVNNNFECEVLPEPGTSADFSHF